jgi:dihydrofolate reductase
MFNWVSADGFFAAPDGNLRWVVPDPAQVKAAVEAIPRFDTILFGRRTFEIFEALWKNAVDSALTAPDPHDPGRRSREHGAIGIWLNEATKFVFSTTLKHVGWTNSRILDRLDPSEINAIKSQPGKDIMLFGSGSIVSQLTEHGLIDEYQLLVCPVLLGSGRSLLDRVTRSVKVDLLEAQKYGSGDIMLRYRRSQ